MSKKNRAINDDVQNRTTTDWIKQLVEIKSQRDARLAKLTPLVRAFVAGLAQAIKADAAAINNKIYHDGDGALVSQTDESKDILTVHNLSTGNSSRMSTDPAILRLVIDDCNHKTSTFQITLDDNDKISIVEAGQAFTSDEISQLLIEPIVRKDFQLSSQ